MGLFKNILAIVKKWFSWKKDDPPVAATEKFKMEIKPPKEMKREPVKIAKKMKRTRRVRTIKLHHLHKEHFGTFSPIRPL